MSVADFANQARPHYRFIQWTAFLVLALLLLGGFALGRFLPWQGQLAFTAFGLATGAAFARLCHPPDQALTLMGRVALICVTASLVFYQLLVWSQTWRVMPSGLGWRLWWVSVVAAVCLGLLQVLWRAGARWEWNSGRTTLGFTAMLGLLLIGLAFPPQLMAPKPAWWSTLAALSALGTLGGSVVLLGRWLRDRPKAERRPLPRGMKTSLLVISQLAVVAGSVYLGRITMPPPSPFEILPSVLAAMPQEKLEQRLTEDLGELRLLAPDLDDLRLRAEALHQKITQAMDKENRAIYSPDETRAIQQLFVEYLAHRDKLLRMAVMYSGYPGVRDERARHRAAMLGFCAAATVLDAGRYFVARYLNDRRTRAKLNEAESGVIQAGMFDEVYHSVTLPSHVALFEQHAKLFQANRAHWRRGDLFATAEFDWLATRIDRCTRNIRGTKLNLTRAWWSRLAGRLQRDVYRPVYSAQEMVATLVGDTRIVERPPFISVNLVQRALREKGLQPGDIILERRNWYLSNAFLPGFWPHAALYIGTPEQLAKLGITRQNAGQAWEAYLRPDNGRRRVILEAVSDGVGFHTAEHSLHADYVMVLRPKLSPEQIATALRRAFSHHGKPYDFNFDFATSDKIVCSELVYHAYQGLLDFELETVLGKTVVTPLGIARKFAREQGTPQAQLEFVLFLDTPRGARHARFANAAEGLRSVNRAKAFNE